MSGGGDKGGSAGYGTFHGPPSYPPTRPPPPLGFPQPVPPPHRRAAAPPAPGGLPCCGIGFGWFLFVIGFFLGAIPWYVGAILLWCSRVDHREKPGYVACTVAAFLATIVVIIGATAGAHVY